MSFFVFKLIFAALVLAMLVVAGFIARSFWRKRQPQAPAPRRQAGPKAPKLRPSKPAAETEPDAPAPPRRRQLQSFAEAERSAAEAEAAAFAVPVVDPAALALAEPAIASEPAAAAEPAKAVEPEALAETEPTAAALPASPEPDSGPDYGQAVLDRLEQAFEALQAGEIALDAYRERVLAEQATVAHRIAVLETDGESDALDAALAAQESVRWCLDWADEQVGPQAD